MAVRSSDNEISQVLSVMSEPTRIRIIRLISEAGELRSCDLLPEFEITQPTLSHHLNVLLENDVLTSRKSGRCVYFSVNKGTMNLVADLMASIANGSASKPASKKASAGATADKPGKKDQKAEKVDKTEKVEKPVKSDKPVNVKPEKVKKDKKDKDKDKKKKKKDKKDKKKKK